MAISKNGGVRHVRCPKCQSVLQEPNVPVYQCGGCGASLRAKIHTSNAQEAVSAPSPLSEIGLPPQSRHLDSSDVASTSASTPDATGTRHHGADATSPCKTDDLMSARKLVSQQVPSPIVEEKRHDQSINQVADGRSEPRPEMGAGSADRSAIASRAGVDLSRGSTKDAVALEDSEKTREAKPEPDVTSKKYSREAEQLGSRNLKRTPTSVRTTHSRSSRAVLGDDEEGKAPSPPRHQPHNMSPLHEKILKTVDELRGDLSELFSKSPEVKPRAPARPPRRPSQDGYASRPAMAPVIPTSTARRAAVGCRDNAGHLGKPGQGAWRGLPSRRYRRCRADPCGPNVHPRSCHHSCCNHGKPECSSCRGHCCRPTAQQPAAWQKPPAKEVKRRAPPRNHCRPVLKGAPFIVCSSCFTLVQVPADFAVSSKKVRKLRCGSCSAVLCYSYRDPDRKKPQHPIDQFSADGSEVVRPDPFSFMEDFANGASYSTEDEQPLHVSRNSSFTTVGEMDGVQAQSTSLHRLMGYGSASELLLQRSPSLYESFDKRTPADAGRYDRKGKGVCVDDDDVDDDSGEEDSGTLKRSKVRGAGWPLPRTLNNGIPGAGAIRIKS